jgi:hypothetical protein
MNAKLDALNDALNGSFSRQEGLLSAILDALQTLVVPFHLLQHSVLIDLISRTVSHFAAHV